MHNLNAVKSLLLLANMLQYVVLTCRLSLIEKKPFVKFDINITNERSLLASEQT